MKIGAKDWSHVFIFFSDEEDFKRFYGRRLMSICEMLMRVRR